MPLDTGDGDAAVLERLPERLEGGPVELGELVQEEHTGVRQRSGMSPEVCDS